MLDFIQTAYDDAKIVLNSIQLWYVGHVNCEANSAAHRLAKAVVHQSLKQFWVEGYPVFIQNIVIAEQFLSS